jgi:hypothetical protein
MKRRFALILKQNLLTQTCLQGLHSFLGVTNGLPAGQEFQDIDKWGKCNNLHDISIVSQIIDGGKFNLSSSPSAALLSVSHGISGLAGRILVTWW